MSVDPDNNDFAKDSFVEYNPQTPEERFEPLSMCFEEAKKKRYQKVAEKADASPIAAIKLKCLDCCAWEYNEAKNCEIPGCPLWMLNRRIFLKEGNKKGRTWTDEQRAAAAERMKKVRKGKKK